MKNGKIIYWTNVNTKETVKTHSGNIATCPNCKKILCINVRIQDNKKIKTSTCYECNIYGYEI